MTRRDKLIIAAMLGIALTNFILIAYSLSLRDAGLTKTNSGMVCTYTKEDHPTADEQEQGREALSNWSNTPSLMKASSMLQIVNGRTLEGMPVDEVEKIFTTDNEKHDWNHQVVIKIDPPICAISCQLLLRSSNGKIVSAAVALEQS